MLFYKALVKMSDGMLGSILSSFRITYSRGGTTLPMTKKQFNEVNRHIFRKYYPGLFVFSTLDAAWKFCEMWGGRTEVWEVEASEQIELGPNTFPLGTVLVPSLRLVREVRDPSKLASALGPSGPRDRRSDYAEEKKAQADLRRARRDQGNR